MEEARRLPFIIFAFALFAIFVFGLIWLFFYSPSSPIGAGWFLFSFAAGLSMIVLPCTLPLAFVIVPLAMGRGYVKGLGIALAFGLGVALTLSLYGLLAAIVGQAAVESLGLELETVKNWLYVLAGLFAITFALTEIGLTPWRLPSYMGAAPGFIQKQGDYLKALLLGMFLGNIGVGCPSPTTYVLLSRIATAEDLFYGWSLFFTHAVGRVTPLIFLALLGIIGINATSYLISHKDKLERAMGWVLVFVGGFIFTLGAFGHDWYVYSGIHTGFETVLQEDEINRLMAGRLGVEAPHAHAIPTGLWLPYGSWLMVGIWALVLIWYLRGEHQRVLALNEVERSQENRLLWWKRWFVITLVILLGLVFGWALPHQFVVHSGRGMEQIEQVEMNDYQVKIQPGEQLTLQILDKGRRPLSGLELNHERILHVVVVADDFSSFNHLHPEDFTPPTDVALETATFSFPYTLLPGRYHLLVDFKHRGQEISRLLRLAAGPPEWFEPIAIIKNLHRTGTFDDYQVELKTEGDVIKSGKETHLKYFVSKDGQPVTDMEPYLGAAMHLAIFSVDFSYALHAHGEIPTEALRNKRTKKLINIAWAHGKEKKITADRLQTTTPRRFGPEIEAHITFPWPGLYKIFGQFKHRGQNINTDFMVEVLPGKNSSGLMPVHEDGH